MPKLPICSVGMMNRMIGNKGLAEEVGFEPTRGFHLWLFSRQLE